MVKVVCTQRQVENLIHDVESPAVWKVETAMFLFFMVSDVITNQTRTQAVGKIDQMSKF